MSINVGLTLNFFDVIIFLCLFVHDLNFKIQTLNAVHLIFCHCQERESEKEKLRFYRFTLAALQSGGSCG